MQKGYRKMKIKNWLTYGLDDFIVGEHKKARGERVI